MLRNWSILRSFSPDVRRLIGVWGFMAFGYFGISSVLVNLYLLRLGYGVEFIGLLIASGQALWAITSLPAGALSRRIGLRTTLILAPAFVAAGLGLMLLVEMLPRSAWSTWLFAGWMISWIGASLLNVSSTPYMMLAARPEERNIAFSTQSAVTAFMGFAGGVVAGLVPALIARLLGISPDDPDKYRHLNSIYRRKT